MVGVRFKKNKENISFQRRWCQGFIYLIWKVFLTSLCNWSAAPLVLNGNEGRPKGMAVLESVHLCFHSEWVTALCTYPFVISWWKPLHSVRCDENYGNCTPVPWFEGSRQHSGQKSHGLLIQNCAVVTLLFLTSCIAGWRKSRWFWEKPCNQEYTLFWVQCPIEINATECSNWEKCSSLRFPWNHTHSIWAKDPEWVWTRVLGFLKLVLVPLQSRAYSGMSQKSDMPLQMCMIYTYRLTSYITYYCIHSEIL